jgi:hypothetical protein
VDAFTIHRTKFDHSAAFRFTAHFSELASRSFLDPHETLQFNGIADSGKPVAVRELFSGHDISHLQSGVHELRASAFEVDFGTQALPSPPSDQRISAYLSHTPFALPEVERISKRYTGETYPSFDRSRPPFVWSSRLGLAHLSLWTDEEKLSVSEVKARALIPRPTVYLELPEAHRTQRPLELLDTWADELRWLTRLLGFLGRNHVHVASLVASSVWRDGEQEAFDRLERWLSGRASQREHPGPLVVPYRLPQDGIDAMLKQLLSLAYKDAVFLAIGFLVDTFRAGVIEDSMASAFTALETVISGVSEAEGSAHIVGDQVFNDLSDHLRNAIKQFSMGGRLSAEQRAAIYRKLPELRRSAIVPRIVDLVSRNQVEWQDLWPSCMDFEKELGNAYGRRSLLVHTGKVADYSLAWNDYLRIHALTERLVYKLIGGREEWVSPLAYRHV